MMFSSPEEANQYIKEEQEKAQAEHEVFISEAGSLISELNADQLKTLRDLIVLSGGSEVIAADIAGTIRGALMFKYGMNWEGKETPWSAVNAESFSPSSDEEHVHGTVEAIVPVVPDAPARKQSIQENINLMSEYGLEPHPDNEYLRCANCKHQYISLEDRMRRPTGIVGCPGCTEKSAWG